MKVFKVAILQHFLASIENNIYRIHFSGALMVKRHHWWRCERHRFDPGLERSPGVGKGNPLQYSCPENSMDRGAWRATESRTQLSNWTYTHCAKQGGSICCQRYNSVTFLPLFVFFFFGEKVKMPTHLSSWENYSLHFRNRHLSNLFFLEARGFSISVPTQGPG